MISGIEYWGDGVMGRQSNAECGVNNSSEKQWTMDQR